jgi:hypothetical protein
VEDGEESLKDSSVLEEEHADMNEVAPQPMHIIVVVIEEIDDEDDLLDEFVGICSSIDVESSSPIYEEHVLQQQQVEIHAILVAPEEVVHEKHEDKMEIISSKEVESLPN